jgi:hypothetical protein
MVIIFGCLLKVILRVQPLLYQQEWLPAVLPERKPG